MLDGSDLSEYQPPGAGPRSTDAFWYIRVADGVTHLDDTYQAHAAIAAKHALAHGAYQFFRETQDPVGQADLLTTVTRPGMLPPALDVETFPLTPSTGVIRVDECLTRLEAQGHRRVVVYMSLGNINQVDWRSATRLGLVHWWLADWGVASVPPSIHGRPVAFWQNRDSGGAGGGDSDYFLGDRAQLDALRVPKPSPGYDAVLLLGLWRHKRLRDRALEGLPPGERVHAAPVRAQGDYGIRLTYGPWRDLDVARGALRTLRARYQPHASELHQAA